MPAKILKYKVVRDSKYNNEFCGGASHYINGEVVYAVGVIRLPANVVVYRCEPCLSEYEDSSDATSCHLLTSSISDYHYVVTKRASSLRNQTRYYYKNRSTILSRAKSKRSEQSTELSKCWSIILQGPRYFDRHPEEVYLIRKQKLKLRPKKIKSY